MVPPRRPAAAPARTLSRTVALTLVFALALALGAACAVACGGGPDGRGTPEGEGAPEGDGYADRMAGEHAGDRPDPAGAAARVPVAALEERAVDYGDGLTGFFARPAAAGEDEALPGLIVIHEWWGLNDNVRGMTRQLAAEGYAALAVDLYGGAVAESPDDARALMQAAMDAPERAEANLAAARDWLGSQGHAGPRVGVIGWCFGGHWSLRTALALGERIDAAVVYYGRVPTDPAELAPLRAPLLGLFGEEDGGIPVETVRAFETALRDAGKEATIRIYPDAGHAFANPSGTRYEPAAAQDAWERTVAFLAEHLREPARP